MALYNIYNIWYRQLKAIPRRILAMGPTEKRKTSLFALLCLLPCLLSAGELQTRGRTVAYLAPTPSGRLMFDLRCVQIGKYLTPLHYRLTNPDGQSIVPDGKIDLRQTQPFDLEGLTQGIYTLEYDAGPNAGRFRTREGKFSVPATRDQPLHPINDRPTLYFQLDAQADQLTGLFRGDAPAEHAALTLRNSQGHIVFSDNTIGKPKHSLPFQVPIPEAERGRIWSAEITDVPDQGFEDVHLQFEEGASPTVALSPEELTRPPYSFFCKKLDDGKWRLFLQVPSQPNARQQVAISLATSSGKTAEASEEQTDGTADAPTVLMSISVDLEPNDLYMGTFTLLLIPLEKDAQPFRMERSIAICQGKQFTEIPWVESGEPATITELEAARGFQLFQRAEPGEVRPNAVPHSEEITETIAAETSPGMTATEFFAIYPLRDRSVNAITLGPLTGPRAFLFKHQRIAPQQVTIVQARMWPQRTDWNADTFVVIPELLEHPDTIELREKSPALFAIQVDVPPDTKPGRYTAPLLMDGVPFATYQLVVDEFTPPEVPSVTFGLYADGERWTRQRFSDEEILREMRDFRAHGMNALMLYPFTDGKIQYRNGHFDIDLSSFRHEMKLYTQVGFPGVAVISFQAFDSFINSLKIKELDKKSPLYRAAFDALLEEIRHMAEEDSWPPYCIHTVDEPNAYSENSEDAVRTLRWIKEAGMDTFNTCEVNFVRSHLAPWLDFRCYANIGFVTSNTWKRNAEIRQETLDAGKTFWWYGTGCYTNGGLQQDGNLYSNRFMLGLFNWRTQATGAWTWTFLRAHDDPYNDMDGNALYESKDACICYPMPPDTSTTPPRPRHEVIPTLQWEALREGAYDYRYLAYWKELCTIGETLPAKAARVQDSREKINAIMGTIPWTCLDGQVTNGQLRELRRALIQEIKRLRH